MTTRELGELLSGCDKMDYSRLFDGIGFNRSNVRIPRIKLAQTVAFPFPPNRMHVAKIIRRI